MERISKNRNYYLTALLLLVQIIMGCQSENSFFGGDDIEPAAQTIIANDATEVEDINVFIYQEDGLLSDCVYSKGNSATLTFHQNKQYSIYAIANIGDITKTKSLKKESGMMSYKHTLQDIPKSLQEEKIPMCYSSGKLVNLKKGTTLSIPLTRCYSIINLKLDKSKLSDIIQFDIVSASIKNIPKSITFFKTSKITSRNESQPEGYTITGKKLSEITTSGISFIMPENMQGTLLRGNKKQSGKVFSESSPYRWLCTYLELVVDYRSKTMYGDSLVYRFYPGDDCYTNFDIVRNRIYNISVTPDKTGINENSWRVETSNLKPVPPPISISLPSNFYTYEGYSKTIIPTIVPKESSYSDIEWSISSGQGNAVINQNGELTGICRGKSTIKVHFKDYPQISATKEVTIKPAVTIFPTPYFELMNYSLWPEMKDTGYPSSAKLNVTKAPNASVEWVIKRYGGQRDDISVSQDGVVSLGATASGHYTIQAKASTGEYYSDYACADIYYYLMYQDIMHVLSGKKNNDGTCDIRVSMGTMWYKRRYPTGTFKEMLSKSIIVNSEDKSHTTNVVGSQYLADKTFLGIPFIVNYKTSAYRGISPQSYAFETVGNYGTGATFRYDTGDWNYYYVKREGGFYNVPTL